MRVPKYRLHKASGQAVVDLGGRTVYLGPYGDPASKESYARALAEWVANGKEAVGSKGPATITELAARYWEWAQTDLLSGLCGKAHGRNRCHPFGPATSSGTLRIDAGSRLRPLVPQGRAGGND